MSNIEKSNGKLLDFTNDVKALASRIKSMLDEVTRDDASDFIDDIHLMRRLLEAAHTAREQMCMFAKVEAEAYVRLSKMHPFETKLRDERILGWLRELSDQEQAAFVTAAERGCTVDAQYEEHMKVERLQRQQYDASKYMEKALREFNDSGEVTVSMRRCEEYIGGQKTDIRQFLADATVSRTRTRLLESGGVCIGDGVYINTAHEKFPGTAIKAIRTRAMQIIADVKSLQTLVSHMENKPSTEDLDLYFGVDDVIDMVLALYLEVGITDDTQSKKVSAKQTIEVDAQVVA